VEDNAGDVWLAREVLRSEPISADVRVARDGEEALAFLRRRRPFARAPRPDLVILDLNLPKKDGREVLADMRKDPVLREIPVAVLTGSKAEEDVPKRSPGPNVCYETKPSGLEELARTLRRIEAFRRARTRR
jgi:CheY-like chemotaxis protein